MNIKKIVHNLKRLRLNANQYKQRKLICLEYPTRVWVEPTNICNLKCDICPNQEISRKKQKQGFMDFGLYKKVIDQVSEFALDINLFDRGEPLLHQELPSMITYAKEKGLRVRLETNATLLTPGLSKEIISAGLDFISFSFDGLTKEVYEQTRRGAKYDETLSNIKLFLKEKGEAKTPYTLLQIIKTPQLKKNSFSSAGFKAFKNEFFGLSLDGFRVITPHRFSGTIAVDKTGIEYGYMDNPKKLVYMPCPYPWFTLTVLYDGTVVPCCMNFFKDYCLGDINKDRLVDIWNSEPMVSLRNNLANQSQDIVMCKGCDLLYQKKMAGVSIKNLRDVLTLIRELG